MNTLWVAWEGRIVKVSIGYLCYRAGSWRYAGKTLAEAKRFKKYGIGDVEQNP